MARAFPNVTILQWFQRHTSGSDGESKGGDLLDELEFGTWTTEKPLIDPIQHHLDIEERKWKRRELSIWHAESRIWNDVFNNCVIREKNNAGLKCAILRQISLERSVYVNSKFHPFLRPKLTPGLPYRMKEHEPFEDELHRSLLQEMAEADCDLNDEQEYDKRRLQRMNAYRRKYWEHDVAVNYEDINADIIAKIEEMEARENGGKKLEEATESAQ